MAKEFKSVCDDAYCDSERISQYRMPNYVGCFRVPPEVIHPMELIGRDLTVKSCLDQAKLSDFHIVGLKNGNECWAGMDVPELD